jgi:hypothetical protein
MQSTACLLDEHIREALKKNLRQQDSTAAIIDELPLMRGRGRADLAFVNGELCGFEIKSEADSLVRLGSQTGNYESVFEFNTIVAAPKHLELASHRLPTTWGIIEAFRDLNGRTKLVPRRPAQRNHKLDNRALARLLWKNECLSILRKMEIETRPHAPVIELWNMIESLGTPLLCVEVREALKRRQTKVVAQQTPCDGLHTTGAIE